VRNGTVTVKVISVSNPEISSTCSIVITGNPSRDNDDDDDEDDDNSTSIPTVPNVTHPSTPDVPKAEAVRVSISLTNGTASSAGTSIELTVKPYIEKGRTMAGLRDVANLLGIENRNVVWNSDDKTIIITMNNRIIQLAVNQNYVIVNGEKMSLDVAPQVRNGRTVLPIAQIARILGIEIQFDAVTKEVIFTREQQSLRPFVFRFHGLTEADRRVYTYKDYFLGFN
ncbi:MAG: hypothetical protein K0S30_1622, partial [Clostridia bacterium]|nr:hypothetical protein [Clostridia bacterium]